MTFDMTKFLALAMCELNNAKAVPADARNFFMRCMGMFEMAEYMSGDPSLYQVWDTQFRPVFEEIMDRGY